MTTSDTGIVRALLSFIVAIALVYIGEITASGLIDSIYLLAYRLTQSLPYAFGWHDIAVGTLGGWVWYYRSFLICLIAIVIWVVSTIILDIEYSRQLGDTGSIRKKKMKKTSEKKSEEVTTQ